MTQEKAVAKRDTSVITQSQAMFLLKTIWKDAPETEVIKAAILCRQYNLNPLMGHIFLIKFNKWDKQTGKKIGEEWAIVRGIRAKRAMAQAKHHYSYLDGPRVMSEEEQKKILGEVEPDKLWAIVVLNDNHGNLYPGYGFWPKDVGVYGGDKGNTPRNMAFIRAEANALDKLEGGELPSMDVADDNYVVGDFQAALVEGKKQIIDDAEQDSRELWPQGGTEPSPEKLEPEPQPGESPLIIDRYWLNETLSLIHWSEETAKSWIKSQLKVPTSGSLIEVLKALDVDKLKAFSDHIRLMREASGQ